MILARREAAAASIRVGIRGATTTTFSENMALTTTYERSAMVHFVMEDPATFAPWTLEAANAAQLAYQALQMAGSAPLRVTQAGIVAQLVAPTGGGGGGGVTLTEVLVDDVVVAEDALIAAGETVAIDVSTTGADSIVWLDASGQALDPATADPGDAIVVLVAALSPARDTSAWLPRCRRP